MIPIIASTIRERRNALLGFSLAAILLISLYATVYPTVHSQATSLDTIIRTMPKGLIRALGVKDVGFTRFESFISTEYLSLLWPLLMIFFTMGGAMQLIVNEIETRTLALLLSFPLSRIHIYLAKLTALLIQIILFVAISIFGIMAIASLHGFSYTPDDFYLLSILCFLFALAVGSIGFVLSSAFSMKSTAQSIGYMVLLGMYVLNILSALSTNLDGLKYFSFFYYYNPSDILSGGSLQDGALLVFGGVILVCLIAGGIMFKKRDIVI